MSGFDYQEWVAEAMVAVARRAVNQVAEKGLPEGHGLYITFDTHAPGVHLPDSLRERYPEQMTVVLEHQFWELATDDEGFDVVLAFGGQRQSLRIAWPAIRGFADPAADFGFESVLTDGTLETGGDASTAATESSTSPAVVSIEERSAPTGEEAADDNEPKPAGKPEGKVVPFLRPTEEE